MCIRDREKTVRHADKIWKEAEARRPTDPEPPPEPEPPSPSPPLQPKDAPYYPAGTPPPVPAGGKAAPMPDDLSKQQDLAAQQEADKQKHAQDEEKAHQDKASKDEADRLQQLRDAETKRVEDSAKQNADRLAAQAEQMRQDHARIQADQARRAQLDAYNAEMAKRAEEARRKEEAERQAKLEDKAKEGPIREASSRYAQALGQNYDIRDPYASLAKSAMAEYAAFRRDREAYDQQIAKSADPQERQRLDLRKRIEGADYLALTGDRIAAQSEILSLIHISDDGRACPSTQPRLCQTVGAHSNPARIGYAPGPFSPGPGLRRALPLRDLPRPGFRALTSTASVFPLAQDEQFYCSRAG